MVDTLRLERSAERRAGSSPVIRTTQVKLKIKLSDTQFLSVVFVGSFFPGK